MRSIIRSMPIMSLATRNLGSVFFRNSAVGLGSWIQQWRDRSGHRYATYLNDIRLGGTFVAGLEASYVFDDLATDKVQRLRLSVNLTNLADVKGFSTVAVTAPSGGFQAYPLSPRMLFVTLGASL
jgi:outer membrane receptor protein involved in Fe transport